MVGLDGRACVLGFGVLTTLPWLLFGNQSAKRGIDGAMIRT